jgi:hypothetical protein
MKARTKDHPHHFGKLKNDVRDVSFLILLFLALRSLPLRFALRPSLPAHFL